MDAAVKRSHRTGAAGAKDTPPNRLKALREARGLTLDALAERVGTTNQQISNLEAGRRRLTVEWLRRLGQALACHPWAVVSDVPAHALSPQQARLIEAFSALAPAERDACLTLVGALARHHASRQANRRK